MNQDVTNSMTTILTDISELQANLLAIPETGDSLDRLCTMRKTAMGVLDSVSPREAMQDGQRQECLDQAKKLLQILAENIDAPMPDSTLFRIGASADSLARQINQYADYRNHAAAERLVRHKKNKSLEN